MERDGEAFFQSRRKEMKRDFWTLISNYSHVDYTGNGCLDIFVTLFLVIGVTTVMVLLYLAISK